MASTRTRTVLMIVGVALLALALIIFSLPLWFPWVLRPMSERFGLEYDRYERLGYTRLALTGVHYSDEQTELEAGRVEALTPLTWLWRRYVRAPEGAMFVTVSDWRLRREPPEVAPEPRPLFQLLEDLEAALPLAERWLPRALLSDGAVAYRDYEFLLGSVRWDTGLLEGDIAWPKHDQRAGLKLSVSDGFPAEVTARVEPAEIDARLRIDKNAERVEAEGTILWLENRLDLAAEFGREDLLPQTARLTADPFRIPAELLNLGGYEDLTGALAASWQEEGFVVELSASAQPAEEKLFPAELVLQAHGDLDAVTLQTAIVSLPWLEAELSDGVKFDFSGGMLSERAVVRLAVDLTAQPWFEARGELFGHAVLKGTDDKYPDLLFAVEGTDLMGFGIQAPGLEMNGEFIWPMLYVDRAEFQVEEGVVSLVVAADVNERVISRGEFAARGHFGNQGLPENIGYGSVLASGQVQGPLPELEHALQVEIHQLRLPQLETLNVAAEWDARHTLFRKIRATVSAGESVLNVEGSGELDTERVALQFEVLDLDRGGDRLLALEEAFAVTVTRESVEEGGSSWAVGLDPLRWTGSGGAISIEGSLAWPRHGQLALTGADLHAGLLEDFFESPLPDAAIDSFDIAANWLEGPLNFDIELRGRFFPLEDVTVSAAAIVRGSPEGILVERLGAGTHQEALLAGEGFLPITINLLEPDRLAVDWEREMDFQASTRPHARFWDEVAEWIGVRVRRPIADLAISGTFEQPQGKLVLSVDELDFPGIEHELPRVERLRADIDLELDFARLNEFSLQIEGQPLFARGRVPIDFATSWREFLDWDQADVEVVMEAEIAPLARFYPELISPQGRLRMDLELRPGAELHGYLLIEEAATRPIMPLGPVHDLNARLQVKDREILIQRFSARVGGQPVSVAGGVDLRERRPDGLPLLELQVQGRNVPLVRQPELILRSDLDITISNRDREVPLISGLLQLRESFYFTDFRPLIPGRVVRPMPRPPFFSIEIEPFADWELRLDIRGDEFLTIRAPFFRGMVSAVFDLDGTLREPVALGEASVPSGLLRFPFANLRVEQGAIWLSSEMPFRPQIFFTSVSRTFGYDIRMEATGFADDPLVEFSSTPALSSEQILLMVTAGDVPRDDFAFSNEQRAARLAFFLGRDLLARLGFGEDEEDRLNFRAGEHISEQGKQTYQLEYRLVPDWSLMGEYDRFGDFNAGVKWRVFSR